MPTTSRGYTTPAAGDPTNVPGDLATLAGQVNNDVENNVAKRAYGINAQTGTAYTLVLTDAAEKLVTLTNAASITCTVPPNSSVAFPVGSVVNLGQGGAGQVTITAGAGVTIRAYNAATRTVGQYAQAVLIKVATDEWWLAGAVI